MENAELSELYLRCSCGNEVLVVERFDDEMYIISMRTMPIHLNFWSRIKNIFQMLKGLPNYEIVLTEEQMMILRQWIKDKDKE